MRSLIWKGATVAIIVTASGTAAGQPQSGAIQAILRTPLTSQAPTGPNHTTVVARILSFDANGDLRIARDELPERMQGLVSRGDSNQDGFLARAEVIALVSQAVARDRTHLPTIREGFAVRRPANLAEIIGDLKLPPEIHDRALEILKEHGASRTVGDLASDERFAAAMRQLLDEEDYENFAAAAARRRNTRGGFVGGIVGGVVRPR
jgi:hypothetical protein